MEVTCRGLGLGVLATGLASDRDRVALVLALWRPLAVAVAFGGAIGPVLLVAGLAGHHRPDGVRLGAATWIVTATRP